MIADPTLTGVVSAFNSLLKLIQAINDSATSVEVKGKLTELYNVIVAGQQSALENTMKQQRMSDEIDQLKKELARVKAWEEEKHRYQLISPWKGCHVYALKESCKGTEPPHWICEHCYQDGRKSILHNSQKHDRRIFHLIKCSHCAFENEINGDAQRQYAEA